MRIKYLKVLIYIYVFIIFSDSFSQNGNPLIKGYGMADPHCYIFNDTAYLFTTRDADRNSKQFVMPDWHIFSSTDLTNWKEVRTIYPSETYMGKSDNCWATETVEKNGKYYFYFSNANKNIGVMVASNPMGPYKDILHHPFISETLTTGKEYDPTLIEYNNDFYIMFGHYVKGDKLLNYHIAKLNQDMISLAENPRIVKIIGDKNVLIANDKPNLHFHNGLFYLSAGSHYAVSKDVYGPYLRIGNSGNEKYGLDDKAHGNYFTKNNQWFHTWCCFFLGKENAKFRESYMTYLHYKKNGEMVTDTNFLDNHFANGIGSYDANWKKIETEWFMSSSRENIKQENEYDGFEITNFVDNDFVKYPCFRNLNLKKSIILKIKSKGNGKLTLRLNGVKGKVIGDLLLKDIDCNYYLKSIPINVKEGLCDLYFCFSGDDLDLSIDYFSFI